MLLSKGSFGSLEKVVDFNSWSTVRVLGQFPWALICLVSLEFSVGLQLFGGVIPLFLSSLSDLHQFIVHIHQFFCF